MDPFGYTMAALHKMSAAAPRPSGQSDSAFTRSPWIDAQRRSSQRSPCGKGCIRPQKDQRDQREPSDRAIRVETGVLKA